MIAELEGIISFYQTSTNTFHLHASQPETITAATTTTATSAVTTTRITRRTKGTQHASNVAAKAFSPLQRPKTHLLHARTCQHDRIMQEFPISSFPVYY